MQICLTDGNVQLKEVKIVDEESITLVEKEK
jgi:hypothetical protein